MSMTTALMLLVALGLDTLLSWPDALFRKIGHPVTWMGALIRWLDQTMNLDGTEPNRRRLAGLLAALIVVAASAEIAWLVSAVLPGGWRGALIAGLIAWPFLATRSLHDHVAAVATPLAVGDLPAARQAVAMIVGRDPERLDEAGVARASLESLAENASDGVIAPLFWGLLLGLPGLVAYKAVNTLDSMIGHKNDRYGAFGWAAARIDDAANFIPARLTGLLFIAFSATRKASLSLMRADAPKHRSPNAGWPEAAMASALGVRLSGPRHYGDRISNEPWINAEAPDPGAEDVRRGLRLYRQAMIAVAAALALLALI